MTYNLTTPQLRYTRAQFIASNPVPISGQLCIETDSNTSKVGDGSTVYLLLPVRPLSGEERTSADDVWAGMSLSDARDAAPPMVAVFKITQVETDAPTIDTTYRNDFGVVPVFAYGSQGTYTATFPMGTFAVVNTVSYLQINGEPRPVCAAISTDDVVTIRTLNTSFAYTDGIIEEGAILTITKY